METISTQATRYLDERQIPYRIFFHEKSVNSLEQAALERGMVPLQVIRSLLFRLPDGGFVMVLVAGPGQIPWKQLRSLLKTSRVTMATDDEVLQFSGCRPGTVTPFGIPNPMTILIDSRISQQDEVSLGVCSSNTAVILKSQDLLKALETYTMVDLFPDP